VRGRKEMRILGAGLLFLLGVLCGSVFAGEVREIELNDGSVICGEIVSFSNGVYTLKSGSLGTIRINESEIRLIHFKSHDTTKVDPVGPSRSASSTDVEALQELMMGDERIMNKILSLQNDPGFQEILQDPAIMNAINSGDINTLLSKPKFMKLLNNPTLREIEREIVQ
jgi:hypothetical protein